MTLTPIDIQQQQFRRAFRGIDASEVREFLNLVAEQFTETVREIHELRTELRVMKEELDAHREREETLKQAMVSAQRAIEEIREQATKEAQLVVTEAEMRAERVLQNANVRVTKLADDLNDLRRQRVRAVEELRGVLTTHVKLLDCYDTDTGDGTVTILDRVRAPSPPSTESPRGTEFA